MAGFEDWSTNSAVYWSDYMILIVALCCAAWAVWSRVGDRNWKAVVQQFVVYCVFLGVAFALSGMAHQSVDDFYWGGHQPSSSWDKMDTGFKHFWLWSMIFFPQAAVAAVGVGLSIAHAEEWGIPAMWCLGVVAAIFEAWLVLGSMIEDSAVVTAVFSFACFVSVLLVVVSTYWTGSGAKKGRWWVIVGMLLQVAGMLLVLLSPHGPSNRYGYSSESQPVEAVFRRRLAEEGASASDDSEVNLTLLFHLLVMVSLCFVCKGVVEVDKYSYVRQKDYEYDVFSKEKEGRRCCGPMA